MVAESCLPLVSRDNWLIRSEVLDREDKIETRDWLLQEAHKRMMNGVDPAEVPKDYPYFFEWLAVNPMMPPLQKSVKPVPRVIRSRR
jgi:hypothetical protein